MNTEKTTNISNEESAMHNQNNIGKTFNPVSEPDMSLCYTIDSLSQAIPLGRSLVMKLVHAQGFPSIKVGNRIIIPKKAFDKWLEAKAFEYGAEF